MPRSKRDSPLPSFSSVLLGSLPFFFVGNQRPVLFAERGDLQLVGIRVGKINASFSRRAQAVLRAKVALVGAAAGGNKLEHPVEVFLADVERHVNRPGPAVWSDPKVSPTCLTAEI